MIKTILLIIAFFLSFDQYGQVNQWFVETTLDKINLKGQVKEVSTVFERNYPFHELEFDRIGEYEFRNFWAVRNFPLGKMSFDSFGFLSTSQNRFKDDTLVHISIKRRMSEYKYEFDSKDLKEKLKQFKSQNRRSFPAFTPYNLQVNYSFHKNLQPENTNSFFYRDTINYLFKYSYEKKSKRIAEELKYRSGHLLSRSKYIYDGEGNIDSIKVTYNENASPRYRSLIDNDITIGRSYSMSIMDVEEAVYSFDYDSLNRLTKAAVVIDDGTKLWEEQYYYNNDHTSPSRLDRFIVSGYTYKKFLSDSETEWYNQYGDPTRTENYNDQGKLFKTRFYEYVYDDRNNWIQCDMYLEGGPEKTSLPTIRLHRDIEYYE